MAVHMNRFNNTLFTKLCVCVLFLHTQSEMLAASYTSELNPGSCYVLDYEILLGVARFSAIPKKLPTWRRETPATLKYNEVLTSS